MIALIPARGGSKGLPEKNIKLLAGIPLIGHSIQCALNCQDISRVIVTTDSPQIAEAAEKQGAEVPFLRPPELATDQSMAIDAYLHAIDFLEKASGATIGEICVLLPTAPLRKPHHISEAIAMFNNKTADSVISYTSEAHPYSWHKKLDEEGRFIDIFESSIDNRQSYEPSYYPNGSIYIFNVALLRTRNYYSPNSYAYIMDRFSSVDIDDQLDFEWAEFLIAKRNG